MLNSIKINNVKGIGHKTFNLDLYPNKPSILVAPNGFGKSSFAIAFKSFNNARMILDDDDIREGCSASDASIEIEHDNNKYVINSQYNTFSRDFSCFVINSALYAKTKGQYMGSFIGHKALLAIPDIELENNVPSKPHINYSIGENRKKFGLNGKILNNIYYLIDKFEFIDELKSKNIDICGLKKCRSYINPINDIKDKINNYAGKSDDIISKINTCLVQSFSRIECLNSIKEIVEKYSENKGNIGKIYLESMQIADFMLSAEYAAYSDWCSYKVNRKYIEYLIKDFDTTKSQDLIIKEQGKNPKKLFISFPSAKRISNGQRDILTFISKLYCAKRKLKKINNVLIIDEIFDYLDDANLIAFQYYITKFIEEYKKNGKKLYCILLTHLDPEFFQHFCFSKHKLQIRYLQKTGMCSSEVLNLMKKREASDDISKYLFHFHSEEKNIEGYKNTQWYQKVYDEVYKKYLSDSEKGFDSLKICLAVRIKIEELAYKMLKTDADKEIFLETHRTKNKLECLSEKGMDYPEMWSLLGLIYNDNLHWKENHDFETPLRSKLSNFVIRHMIQILFNDK